MMLSVALLYRMAEYGTVDLDYHMMDYHPYRKGQGNQDRDSQTIVYWKAGYLEEDESQNRKSEFGAMVLHWLRECVEEVKGTNPLDKIMIGIAPGHKPPGSESLLMNGLGIEGLNNDRVTVILTLLQRRTQVPKQATSSGMRNINTHLRSINVVGDITGQVVCILDDVWTSGCTLRACHQLVTEQGAKKVYLFAIGKTV